MKETRFIPLIIALFRSVKTYTRILKFSLFFFASALTQHLQGELVVAPGLAVQPFTTPKQLSNPASIDVDHRGRVWVAEAVNYRKKARTEGDRILILEDSDGDGRVDKTKVFYQDPDIDGVHGVCVLGNQAIVSAPDRILLLTDTDGDDQADERKLLFRGKVLNAVQGQHDHAKKEPKKTRELLERLNQWVKETARK